MDVEKRVDEWLQELISKGKPVELISFYEELPIRVKSKPISVEEKFVQWESHPKLKLAVDSFGRVYTIFKDPMYNQNRVLAADVTYYNDNFIETTKPKPFEEPRLSREFPRVTVSPKLPVKLLLLPDGEKFKEEKVYKVIDISENGIGFLSEKGEFSIGDKIKVKIDLPYGSFQSEAEVRSLEPQDDKEKTGVKFLNLHQRFRNFLHRYVMTRQREILDKIRLLVE